MTDAINDRPNPEDVWGIEILDPVERFEWAQARWLSLQTDSNRRLLLLTYVSSAEKAALRCLRYLARFGGENAYEPHMFSGTELPLLPPIPDQSKQLCLIHRATRYMNVKEWLNQNNNPASLFVFTVPRAELAVFPLRRQCLEFEVPHLQASRERQLATGALLELFRGGIEDNSELRRLIDLIAEIGNTGVEISLKLIMKAQNLSYNRILWLLNQREVCHLVKLAPHGPLLERKLSFRGQWLAKYLIEKNESHGYPAMRNLLQHVDPRRQEDRLFCLHFLIALRARQEDDNLVWIRHDFKELISACKHHGGIRERLAWLFFLHDGLDFVRVFFFGSEQKAHYLMRLPQRLLDFDFRRRLRLSL